MKKVFISFLILFSFSVNAQTSELLIGKWKFKDVNNTEGLDSTKRANLKKAFADLEIDLRADKTYTSIFLNKGEGTWAFDDSLKVLILTKKDKTENRIRIISATDKALIFVMNKDKELVLEKISPK